MNVLSLKSFKAALTAFLLAVLLAVSMIAVDAHAGSRPGGGRYTGQSVNSTAVLDWQGNETGSTYKKVTVDGFVNKGVLAYIVQKDLTISSTRAYACTDFSVWGQSLGKAYGTYQGGSYSETTGGGRTWNFRSNWIAQGTSVLKEISSDLLNSSITNDVVYQNSSGILMSTNYGTYLAAVWVDPSKEWITKTSTTYKEVIVYYTDSDGDSWDIRSKDAEYMWSNGKTSYPYSHTTAAGNTSESWTVTAKIQVIKCTKTWQYNASTGKTKNVTYTYSKGASETVTRTFKYSADTPNITQEKYAPLNLNRNGYATSEDIDSSYADASTKIQATVDNQQGITDNSDLNSLDINNEQAFTFKFTNYTFGLPDKYDWANQPAELENGTYEDVDPDASYANGRNDDADEDGYFRYNLKFYASITTNSTDSSIETASLTIDDTEYTANSVFTKSYDSTSSWTGGDMSARFVYMDTYYTDNGLSSTDFAKWWVVTYSQSRYYEYGSSWSGKITAAGTVSSNKVSSSSGVQDPTVNYGTYTKGSSTTTKSGTDKITTDADAQQRGLYVGLKTVNFEQPILYAHWNVVTVAGTLN